MGERELGNQWIEWLMQNRYADAPTALAGNDVGSQVANTAGAGGHHATNAILGGSGHVESTDEEVALVRGFLLNLQHCGIKMNPC